MGAKATHDISPKIRRAFIRAATRIGNGDAEAGLAQLIERELNSNTVQTLNALAKFLPREHQVSGKVEHDHKHEHTHESVSDTSRWITEVLGEGQTEQAEKPLSH